MSAENPGLGKFTQFMPNHIFGNEHFVEYLPVMDEKRMSHKLRANSTSPCPSFDRLFFADGFQFLDLSKQWRRNERTFFDWSAHNLPIILQRKAALGRGGGSTALVWCNCSSYFVAISYAHKDFDFLRYVKIAITELFLVFYVHEVPEEPKPEEPPPWKKIRTITKETPLEKQHNPLQAKEYGKTIQN